MPALHQLTLRKAHDLLRSREASSVEITQACLDRISSVEPEINAFVTITGELALQQAREADANRSYDQGSALAGIPFPARAAC